MNSKQTFINYAKERNIGQFIHFTNVLNLPSILQYGLLTKECLDKNQINYEYNDDIRLEKSQNSISVSITSPNYRMFYKIRKDHPKKNWVVLLLDPYQILNLDCAFCYTNAANQEISSRPLSDRQTLNSFETIFAERIPPASRQELGNLASFEPTDPQAEILVFNTIPPSAIQFALFNNQEILNHYKQILETNHIECTCDAGYFSPRRDYSFWQF